MIILQKNESGASSTTTLLAEVIVEYFEGKSIDHVFKLGGKSVPKALKLLADLDLIRIEGDKIILTKEGKDFVNLPHMVGGVGELDGDYQDHQDA